MNEDEFKGGVRYVKGKIEKGVGDIADSTEWQVDGIVDQVAGGAQNLYGRAKETVEDVAANAADFAADAGAYTREISRRGQAAIDRSVEDNPWAWIGAAVVAGYALSWLIHGKHR